MRFTRLPRYSQAMARLGKSRSYTLRRAAAVVFALISVLPLLLFAYTLYALSVLHVLVAQIGLGSALVISMIGYYIYSVMMSRLSAILRDLEARDTDPTEPGASHAPAGTTAVEPGASGPMGARGAGSVSPEASTPGPGLRGPLPAKSGSATGGLGGLVVPGMGRIKELKPADGAAHSDLDSMWRAEAEPLLGKRVVVAVRNAQDPMKGVLSQVTPEGVILDQNGSKVGISYTRMSAIEADTAEST